MSKLSVAGLLLRVGRAGGLSPLILATLLAGCDDPAAMEAQEPAEELPAELDVPAMAEAEAPADVSVGADFARDPASYTSPELRLEAVPVRGHVVVGEVHGVPPQTSIQLFYGAVEGLASGEPRMVDPVRVANFVSGSRGDAPVRGLIPANAPADVAFQVAIGEGESLVWGVVQVFSPVDVVPDVAGLVELHPGSDVSTLAAQQQYRVCVPKDEAGDCLEVTEDDVWGATGAAGYAMDHALPTDLMASACMPDAAFDDSCCIAVELWKTNVGAPVTPCVDDTVDPGNWGWGWYGGRPLSTIDGPRQAPVRLGAGWFDAPPRLEMAPEAHRRAVVSAWSGLGRAEHASVASFARFTLELMALGAPAELLAQATRAQADEIRHAELAFSVASALGGQAVEPGALNVSGSLARSHDPEAVLRAAVIEGCIEETIASLQMAEAARRAEPGLAELLEGVADDEARHAELSWAAVRWMLAERPELASVVADVLATYTLPVRTDDGVDRSRWGLLPAADAQAVAEQVFAQVVRPALGAMLAA